MSPRDLLFLTLESAYTPRLDRDSNRHKQKETDSGRQANVCLTITEPETDVTARKPE